MVETIINDRMRVVLLILFLLFKLPIKKRKTRKLRNIYMISSAVLEPFRNKLCAIKQNAQQSCIYILTVSLLYILEARFIYILTVSLLYILQERFPFLIV